jgi:hypothetical protein
MRSGPRSVDTIVCHNICNPGPRADGVVRCVARSTCFPNLTSLWSSILCPVPEFSLFHRRQCLMGDRENCGIQQFKVCDQEYATEQKVQWRHIGSEVVGKTRDGRDKKVPRVMFQETVPREMITYLRPKMEEFTVHNFFARWQEKEFKHFLKNIPPETVVSYIDFSENYGMKVQNEIQSMHWYTF